MTDAVTPGTPELSGLNETDPTITTRAKNRERVRRHRALKKQAASIEFVRTDASLYLHPDRLSQKAGAPKHHLRRMALKELVDNALDAAPNATLTEVDRDTFVVTDDGPGIPPEKVVALFSVTRPMMSSKLIRRPTRGAVGNGLRVATGAAFASGGRIVVESEGVRQGLTFDRATGETVVSERSVTDIGHGTRITIEFGAALPVDPIATSWGNLAIRLSGQAMTPMLTHPDWYSELSFNELTEAARGSAQDLAGMFGVDLCNAYAHDIEPAQSGAAEHYIGPDDPAHTLTLGLLKSLAPKPPRLLPIADDAFPGSYKIERVSADVAGARVPAIVQVWASEHTRRTTDMDIRLIINRTPAVADIVVDVGGDSFIRGCGLPWCHIGTVPKGAYGLVIAVTTPAIALISDGKTPDLTPFQQGIVDTVGPALRRAHRPKKRDVSIKDAAFAVMEEAYLIASADGTLPANARQIMYAARPFILEHTGLTKLNDVYFTQTLLPAFMEENSDSTKDWDVVYDARGHLIEPHTNHSLPLGTIHVREYLQRRSRDGGSLLALSSDLHPTSGPGDRYGAVLFIEKEGFEPLLRKVKIAERFDVAVMSTKGMSVIAARTLVDRLSAEGTRILVAHDLDMAGIRIFGTLGADSHRYSFSRRPDIRRLGLTLEQAQDMDLQAERQEIKGDHERILNGLRDYGATEPEVRFIGAGQRVELNAMASNKFVAWLEAGFREHGVQKVVPSEKIIEQRARQIVGIQHVKKKAADLERAGKEYAAKAKLPDDLADRVRREFERDPSLPWEEALANVMEKPT